MPIISNKMNLAQTLQNELPPLIHAPHDEKTGTSQMNEGNHFGWVVQFNRMLKIEKLYLNDSNLNLGPKIISKIENVFYAFIKSMTSLGFDVNKDLVWQGYKPLHKAVLNNCKVVANCLIRLGAAIDDDNRSRQTPLYLAAWNSQHDMVDLLIKKGANVKKKNNALLSCDTLALHIATCPKVIQSLVSAGTSVNATSKDPLQYTALHWAAHCARPDAVETLLKLGSIDIRDQGGLTALDVAKKIQSGEYSVMMDGKENPDAKTVQSRIVKTIELLESHHKSHPSQTQSLK